MIPAPVICDNARVLCSTGIGAGYYWYYGPMTNNKLFI